MTLTCAERSVIFCINVCILTPMWTPHPTLLPVGSAPESCPIVDGLVSIQDQVDQGLVPLVWVKVEPRYRVKSLDEWCPEGALQASEGLADQGIEIDVGVL